MTKNDHSYPILYVVGYVIYFCAILTLVIIVGGGDWTWFNGWTYVISVTLVMGIGLVIINQRNPGVIRNRSRLRKTGITDNTKKDASSDRFIMPLIGLCLAGIFFVSIMDYRSGWSKLPIGVSILGLVITIIGVFVVNLAQLQNTFASKTLDINPNQQLVDTGLYGIVRHPFYTGFIIWMMFTPIALGSISGIVPAIALTIIFIIRIHFEERMLVKGIQGYRDYQARVKYRIIPGIY